MAGISIKALLYNGLFKRKKIAFFLAMIFILTSFIFPDSKEIVFGSEIAPISSHNVKKEKLTIPSEGKVTVLFFFNIDNSAHQKALLELNFLFMELVDVDNQVELFGISRGDEKKFKNAVQKYGLKYSLINDKDNKFLSFFDFKCGACVKVVIIDKIRKLRYNASYLNLHFVKTIARRYKNGGN